jgi:hypothetical protein
MLTNPMMMVLLYPQLKPLGHCHSVGSVPMQEEEEYPSFNKTTPTLSSSHSVDL